ncbi:MAG: hypothetical protein K6C95_10475 [Lachnospiraceae bacterium]|nr:hypothetical protein [Lachnospiraceae bacterium]
MKKVIIGILIALGILFVVIMLMPDDEKPAEERPREEAQVSTDTEVSSGENASQPVIQHGGVETVSVGSDAKSATIMVYMNGSDLESEAGEASEDISEMLSSGVGDNVNVIIQTMGTREWQDHGISPDEAQTFRVKDGKLTLLRDDLGQLDCTSKNTMSEFIDFCKKGYPAERYMFVFWDHGGGPVYGFGYDEWQDEQESLTLNEISRAFSEHPDIRFDIIGMDCCIMADLETCYALAPYCRYTLLSEDFESGLGWNYKNWMKRFEENPGISTPLLGKYIVDAIIEDNEKDSRGDSACIGLFNEATVNSLFDAWKKYAYLNETALMEKNYSRLHMARGRGERGLWDFLDLWGSDMSDVTLSDYYISDILALVESIDNKSDEAKSLMSALKASVVYCGHTSDKNELTGLAVSLPYGDPDFYEQMRIVYTDLGIDQEYIEWLGGFVSESGYEDYFDFGGFEDNWGGWGAYEDEYGCNISGGGSCEYGYDYSQDDEYGLDEDGYCDDWIYDCEEDIWYMYDDDTLYLYDEEEDVMCYYDEESDVIYYYDEDRDDWLEME